MYIQENLDYDLRVVVDLDDHSDCTAEGVDALPYTFTLLEDNNFWDDDWSEKTIPDWQVIFSEKFDEYSSFLNLPDIVKNSNDLKNNKSISLYNKYINGSDWKICLSTENSEDENIYYVNIQEGASRRSGISLTLYEEDMKKLVSVIEETRKILEIDKKRAEEKEKLRHKLNDEFYITFRPEDTNIHSFDNNPPKTWNDVYKVYYSYKIEEVWSFEDEYSCETVLDTGFDECSCMPYLAEVLEHFDDEAKNNILKVRPFGDGVDWEIERFYLEYQKMNYYTFKLFNGSIGCRFTLSEKELYDFIVWLKYINEYAFKVCGCGI